MPAALEGLEWARLGMLAAGIIVVVLFLLLLTKACGGSSAESKNKEFFGQVGAVLRKSDQAGQQLHELLHPTQPVKRKELLTEVAKIEGETKAALDEATALQPTKQVAGYQPYLVQTLAYRHDGLDCLRRGLPQALKSKPATTGGALLVPCTKLLFASDVIYTNSYYASAGKALQNESIELQVPTSAFLQGGDASLLTAAGMASVLDRWKPGSVAHGLHGLTLGTVIAKDGAGQTTTLHAGTVNKVKASGLTFLVTATNGGHYTEFNIPVVITIGSGKNKIVKQAIINQIARGSSETVTISGFSSGGILPYAQSVKMRVRVTPVPGERTASNNSATYEISFSL
jgi:hypothetical protein